MKELFSTLTEKRDMKHIIMSIVILALIPISIYWTKYPDSEIVIKNKVDTTYMTDEEI